MKDFTIRELEAFSDIKMHTIRMWERRYAILQPQRNKGIFRFYTLEEVKYFLTVALLAKSGTRISRLAALSEEELEQKSKMLTDEISGKAKAIRALIYYMFSGNIDDFESVLDSSVHAWGIDSTIEQIIIPFLEKTKIFAYDYICTERHFVVTAVRRKIILGIEKANAFSHAQKTALLFLPEGEHYDLMLLYMSYVLKGQGFRVLYMGTDITFPVLETAIKQKMPHFLFTYIAPKFRFNIETFLPLLKLPALWATLFVVSSEARQQQDFNNPNVRFIHYRDVKTVTRKHIEDYDSRPIAS